MVTYLTILEIVVVILVIVITLILFSIGFITAVFVDAFFRVIQAAPIHKKHYIRRLKRWR